MKGARQGAAGGSDYFGHHFSWHLSFLSCSCHCLFAATTATYLAACNTSRSGGAPRSSDPPCPHRSRLNTPQGSQLHPGCSSQLVRLKLHLPPLPPTPGSGVSGFFRQKADVESRPNVGLNLAEGHHARKATLHTEVLYNLAVLLHRGRNYLQGLVAVIHSYCLVASRLVGAVFIILFRILLSA